MIIEGFVICVDAASKNNVEYDLLKSINDTVFKEIVDWSRNPTSLRLELKKFGTWYFKKAKTKDKIKHLENTLKLDFKRDDEEKVLSRINNYNFIISEYEKYSKDRYEIKCEKYGKENYEAYCLDNKQKKLQKTKENKLR